MTDLVIYIIKCSGYVKYVKFHEIISMVEMKPEIKVLMEGLVKQMSHDEELVTGYKTWKNEEERRNSFNEGIAQNR